MNDMSSALRKYLELLDELLRRRAVHGLLSDDEEESFANALYECRADMTDDEQEGLDELIINRRAATAPETLGLVDTSEPWLRKTG